MDLKCQLVICIETLDFICLIPVFVAESRESYSMCNGLYSSEPQILCAGTILLSNCKYRHYSAKMSNRQKYAPLHCGLEWTIYHDQQCFCPVGSKKCELVMPKLVVLLAFKRYWSIIILIWIWTCWWIYILVISWAMYPRYQYRIWW